MKSDNVLREVLPDSNHQLYFPPIQQKAVLSTTKGNSKCGQCNHCSNNINANSLTFPLDVGLKVHEFINCNILCGLQTGMPMSVILYWEN